MCVGSCNWITVLLEKFYRTYKIKSKSLQNSCSFLFRNQIKNYIITMSRASDLFFWSHFRNKKNTHTHTTKIISPEQQKMVLKIKEIEWREKICGLLFVRLALLEAFSEGEKRRLECGVCHELKRAFNSRSDQVFLSANV